VKIAVLSSAPAGGAGIAAYRVFEALNKHESHSVDFLDINTIGHVSNEISPSESATNKKITNTHFTIDYASGSRSWLVDFLTEYDCLNIHWSSCLLSASEILMLAKLGKSILFTLHDFYYITGGCHYPAGCTGYMENCISCPQVNEQLYSLQHVIRALKLKREIFSHANVHLSAPSKYIVDSAVYSRIIPKERGHVLRNAYDVLTTSPALAETGIFSLLLIADSFLEERKGIELAINSIKEFCKRYENDDSNFNLHIVGTCDKDIPTLLADSKLSLILHGHVRDHSKLVHIFQQCQYQLTCSYEDNWPNTLVEAGAYGCIPIVGMGHGCEEFCREFNTGIVAKEYTPDVFADCLTAAKNTTDEKRSELQKDIRKSVRSTHSFATVSIEYIRVFTEITKTKNTKQNSNSIKVTPNATLPVYLVSENFLGQTSRSLLASIRLGRNTGDSIELAIEDSPFAAEGPSGPDHIAVIFEGQVSKQYIIGQRKNTVVPVKSNDLWATCVFLPKSKSFGLRHIRIQLGKH